MSPMALAALAPKLPNVQNMWQCWVFLRNFVLTDLVFDCPVKAFSTMRVQRWEFSGSIWYFTTACEWEFESAQNQISLG